MTENHLLPPPVLPQANNGVLDKSKLQGEDIKVLVPTSPATINKGDKITVTFTHGDDSFSHAKHAGNNLGQYIEVDFSPEQVIAQQYDVSYVIENTYNPANSAIVTITVVDGTSTKPPPTDEPFIIMGARSTNYLLANGLKGPQCLTAWDKDTKQPLAVTWQYDGSTLVYDPLSYENSTFFYDTAPNRIILVSHGNSTLRINPLNVFGNGGTLHPTLPFNSEDYNNIDDDSPVYLYPSTFAALLTPYGPGKYQVMVGWGGYFNKSFTLGNKEDISGVLSLTTNGGAYAAIYIDPSQDMLFKGWGIEKDGAYIPPYASQMASHFGAGGQSFIAENVFGGYTIWDKIKCPTTDLNEGHDVPTLFAGNNYGITCYLPDSGTIQTWYRSSVLTPTSDWTKKPLGGNYQEIRSITPIADGFVLLNKEGYASVWGNTQLSIPDIIGSQGDYVQVANTPKTGTALLKFDTHEVWGWGGQFGSDSSTAIESKVQDMSTTMDTILFRTTDYAVKAIGDLEVPDDIQSLKDIVQVVGSAKACAALRKDGTVVTWGDTDYGGDCTAVQGLLTNVRAIYSTGRAFVALTATKSVITWGDFNGGGDSSEVQQYFLNNLTYYLD
ncbi:hypothetical protein [Xenorhabdus lircayensis]|uniref:Uncharacterized protein n=1 Tax=Xenorhabdus lircayensis TaxID=2763499 RepID=A0ABS0U1E0_9GAMM|nr:hypothetical protein [Xenorhabdus lircayensis]MBI6547699.1 hypothetical protein [Xenorhabdus lircayensis]